MSRRGKRHNNGQNGQALRTFDLTRAALPQPIQSDYRVYIIVKYFDEQLDYCFQDRVSGTSTFKACGIEDDYWTEKEEANALLKRVQDYNPGKGYGLAFVPFRGN